MNTEMTFSADHWMARWYKHFERLGGRVRHPENLCRFLRVVLFWAPLRWFFSARLDGGLNRFPPYAFALVGSVATFILYQAITHFRDALMLSALILGGALIFFAVSGLVNGLSRITRRAQRVYTDTVQTARWYREARAGRLCPIIRFTDQE